MLKVTYGQLRDTSFSRGVMKIANCAQLKTPQLAYNIAKINARLTEEAKLADELFQKLVDQYAQKDPDGKLTPHDGKKGTFFIPDENAAEWGKKLIEFLAVEVEIDRPAINLDDVMVVGLSPAEISALGPLIYFNESPLAEVRPLAP